MTTCHSSGITGTIYCIKNIGTAIVTVDGNASETIDGALTYAIRNTNGYITIISDGTNWLILDEKPPRIPSVGSSYWKNTSLGTVCPALEPQEIAENGQVLSDAQSVFNGVTMYDTNGAVSGIKRFNRGSSTSGTTGGTETHAHSISNGTAAAMPATSAMHMPLSATDFYSTLPSYIEKLSVMRIK